MQRVEGPGPLAARIRLLGNTVLYTALAAFVVWLVFAEPGKVAATVVKVTVAVVLSGGLFVGAHKLFDQAPDRWDLFSAVVGALGGAVVFGVLDANRLLRDIGPRPLVWGLVGLVIGAGTGWGTSRLRGRDRLALGVGVGVAVGVVLGVATRGRAQPALEPIPALIGPLLGALAAGTVGRVRRGRRAMVRWALVGATVGWILGGFGTASIGRGSPAEAVVAFVVVGALLGARLGLTEPPDRNTRSLLEIASRRYIFLAPAMAFILGGLIVPLLRTIYLSVYDARTVRFVGLENYGAIFSSDKSFKISDWADVFTSRLAWFGAGVVVLGLVVGSISGRRRRSVFELDGGSVPALGTGVFLLSFAVLSVLRGTIFNNLWWVVAVTTLATGLGLAIAVLADRARLENVAKSLIFMPMAISFVGASIIWRFMYIARDTSKQQTGVFNSIWVWLGRVSNGPSGQTVILVVVGVVVVGCLAAAVAGWRRESMSIAVVATIAAVPAALLFVRLLDTGIGGYVIGADGTVEPDTILFLTEPPFNNLWLMVVLIWIQTGFAMVIFSAAIKAVPAELIEAAEVDGATEAQTFWRVVVPQILPTIGVVVTTIIVTVMKVFDIVKVMTNGNFDTQVIANEMWQRAFTELNFGLGSALAVLLFVSVLPIMYYNIRRMQEAQA